MSNIDLSCNSNYVCILINGNVFSMKLFRMSLILIVYACLIGACRKNPNELQTDKSNLPEINNIDFNLDEILERGKIIAIIENNSTGYFIYKGQTMGYEYELLTNFSNYLGVDFEMVITKSLEDAFNKLYRGEGDIIAFPLTVTRERKKKVMFSDYQYTVRQVLVQRKPENWRQLKIHEIESKLIRNPVDLIGKTVHIRYHSSYLPRMVNLSEEIGGDIEIIEELPEYETEDLIKKVADGEIEFTVADEDVALVNATYYSDIDVKTAVSFPTRIAWAVRRNAFRLRDTINVWQRIIKREPTFNVIYNKYFNSPKTTLSRVRSDYFSMEGGKISAYDALIKEYARKLNWDWRLLAAQIFQESKFDPNTKSWAGAVGLMQLMPATGKQYGALDLYEPEQNIRAGTAFLIWLKNFWTERIEDPEEMKKFVLASYNVGLGHVIDARALAVKYDKNQDEWEGNVAYYLLMKSKPEYYKDPVVKSGYCRGEEPVKYVKSILNIYQDYSVNFPDQVHTLTTSD